MEKFEKIKKERSPETIESMDALENFELNLKKNSKLKKLKSLILGVASIFLATTQLVRAETKIESPTEVTKLVEGQVLNPLVKIDSTQVYATENFSKYAKEITSLAEPFLNGINRANKAFDNKETLKSLNVYDSKGYQAANFTDTAEIRLTSRYLKDSSDPQIAKPRAELTGAHERFHALVDKNNLLENFTPEQFTDLDMEEVIVKSQKPLTSYWAYMNMVDPMGYGYLQKFNESSYLNILGGHAQDSPSEFVASLINIVTHEKFDEISATKNYGDLKVMCSGIKTLKLALEKNNLTNLPLYKTLNEKLDLLSDLEEEKFDPKVEYKIPNLKEILKHIK